MTKSKSNVIQLNAKKNLYVVDEYFVILATSDVQALQIAQEAEETFAPFNVRELPEDKVLHAIQSDLEADVQFMLWNRSPLPNEKPAFTMTVREFINIDLNGVPIGIIAAIEKDDVNMSSIESVIEELEVRFNRITEEDYTYEDITNWAVDNVPTLFQLLRQESEIADMYRGLKY